jgi:ribosomal protein S19E (S16A)
MPFLLEQELARMVRHLALKDKVSVLGRQQVYEGEKSEGSVPVIQSRQKGA